MKFSPLNAGFKIALGHLILMGFVLWASTLYCPPNPVTQTLSNLKAVSTATLLYTYDWDDRFPPHAPKVNFRRSIARHTGYTRPMVDFDGNRVDLFTDPKHNVDIQFNPNLEQVQISLIANPQEAITLTTPFHDSPDKPLKKHLFARVDGSAKNIDPIEWAQIRHHLRWQLNPHPNFEDPTSFASKTSQTTEPAYPQRFQIPSQPTYQP